MMPTSVIKSSLANKLLALLERSRTGLWFGLGVLLLVFSVALTPAAASEPKEESQVEYTVIDRFTGEEVLPGETPSSNEVTLTSNSYYDRNKNMYYFRLQEDEAFVRANICDGMVTTNVVRLYLPEGYSFTLYQDGNEYSGDVTQISTPGKYVLQYILDTVPKQVLAFRIVDKVVADLYLFEAPSGFRISQLLLNDEELRPDRYEVDMSEEGNYEITYVCPAADLTETFSVTIDHTPPQILLEGLEDGLARGPVKLVNIESDASLEVFFEGERVSQVVSHFETEFTQSGQYFIALTDKAGNRSTAQFTILIYFDASSILFFIVLVVGVIACIVYIYVSRKRLRIR